MMDIMQAVRERHSVRAYLDKPLRKEDVAALEEAIGQCNGESGLSMQLVANEPKVFGGMMAKYGKFSGVRNYIAVVGDKNDAYLEEKSGYYGERLVLLSQQLGLNTCWVGMTFKKVPEAYCVNPGQKLVIVVSLGFGETQGKGHPVKEPDEVSPDVAQAPDWFRRGVECALLAPTAMNQQKFTLRYEHGRVAAKAGRGFFSKVDLGIVKYHFELGARPENVSWA